MTQRISHIDLASGIMIIWMVTYHAIGVHDNSVPTLIYELFSFFMPWFFYKSGYFFISNKGNFVEGVRKDARKLLKMFVIWSMLGLVMDIILMSIDGSLTQWPWYKSYFYNYLLLRGSIPLNTPCWFLLSLFIVRSVARISYQYMRPLLVAIMCVVFAILCKVYCPFAKPLWLWNSITGLAFFSMGNSLKNIELKWQLSIPCIVLYITALCRVLGDFSRIDMWSNNVGSGCYALWFPTALCGIILLNNLCYGINFLLEKFFSEKALYKLPLHYVSQFAMEIYVIHFIVREVLAWVVNQYIPQIENFKILIVLIGYILLIPLIIWAVNAIKRRVNISYR